MNQILLIEDEEPIRRVMVKILTEEDASYEVTEAENGKAGLNALKKRILTLYSVILKCQKWMVLKYYRKQILLV